MFILNLAHQWYIIIIVVIIIYPLFTLMHFVSTNGIHTFASTGASQFALSTCAVPRCTPICAYAWNNILAGLRDWGQGYQQWSQLTILHSPANELRWRQYTLWFDWLHPHHGLEMHPLHMKSEHICYGRQCLRLFAFAEEFYTSLITAECFSHCITCTQKLQHHSIS